MLTKKNLFIVIFGTDTKAGKNFDIILLFLILINVLVVMMESIPAFGLKYPNQFLHIEIVFTILFAIEYIVRIYISPKPLKYIFSFWGFIDLLSIFPTYFSLFISGYHYLLVLRIFRLLRVFRVLKLVRFMLEAQMLLKALKSSLYKISIFLFSVIAIVTFLGTIMYVVEGGKVGFTSIPQSMYWAVVTVTTVGYGDMVPHTVLGKFISSIAMIIGYAIIAVPTGIITFEIAKSGNATRQCPNCKTDNKTEASYCNQCGVPLND